MNPATSKFAVALVILLLGSSLAALSQNLTGIWRGYFHTSDGDEYRFELQIEQTKTNRISGVSYSYLDKRFYGKATLTGNFNKTGKSALIQEIKTVEVKMSGSSFACIMKCAFVYTKSGKEEFLEGTYTSTFEKSYPEMGVKRGEACGPGKVYLRKVTTSDFYVEPFLRNKVVPKTDTIARKPVTKPPVILKPKTEQQKPKPKPPVSNVPVKKDTVKTTGPVVIEKQKERPRFNPPAETRSRENELVKTFTVSDEEVTVKFYDNGEIDNDTISVYLDGKAIISNQRLSTSPIMVKIKMDEDYPEHTLVMVAENLGRIPPNTSLMVVQDGDNRYQASITSTEQKNAMVRFRYQKKG
jgi:hypothetical protein